MSILSIQSHVSFGHVGNAAGVFILQRMGFDVWPIHTVLFSNHPGYGGFRGQRVAPDLIGDIVTGVEERGAFEDCEAVIGGYLGAAGTGEVLLDAVDRVRRANPASLFFCDPVMGDGDKGLYVSDDVVQFYKERGAPAADILKPNAFELGVLAEQPVRDPETAHAAAHQLIEKWNLRAVVVSSVPVPAPASGDAPLIACLAVTRDQAWCVQTPLLPVDQKGAGDAFMALFVANILRANNDFAGALSAAVSAIWSVMDAPTTMDDPELRLIAGQKFYLEPSQIFKALALYPIQN